MKTLPVSFNNVKSLRYNKTMADLMAQRPAHYRQVLNAPQNSQVMSKLDIVKQSAIFFDKAVKTVKNTLIQK